MNVYYTTLYISLEKPLKTAIICDSNTKNELYRGPFEQIPETLFDRKVESRLYEYGIKSMKLWVRA